MIGAYLCFNDVVRSAHPNLRVAHAARHFPRVCAAVCAGASRSVTSILDVLDQQTVDAGCVVSHVHLDWVRLAAGFE